MELCRLMAIVEDGAWHFGIGDPTPVGWFTVLAYLSATIASGLVCWREFQAARDRRSSSPVFWLVLTLLLLFLGINKQLDLQTLLNDIGRRKARAEGWYGERRFYQVIFIAGVSAIGLASLCFFSWLARKRWKRNFMALLGVVLLYVFVLIRASSIHHVDIALQSRFAGAKWNWIFELGGIAIVLLGAGIAAGDQHRRAQEAGLRGPTKR
jgi:hypothetical protein